MLHAGDKELLERSRPELMQSIDVEGSTVLAQLRARRALTPQQNEIISTKAGNANQVGALLDVLLRGDANTMDQFIYALRRSGHSAVVDAYLREPLRGDQLEPGAAVDGGSSMSDLAEQLRFTREDSNASTRQKAKPDQPEFPNQHGNSRKHPRKCKRLKESVKDISINQETAFMKKIREDTKVKLQDCRKILIELKRDSTDLGGSELKERKTKLCQMLDIPEAKWIDEQKPIETRFDNLLTDITDVLRATKENPPILQTFVNASAGLALKGILHLVGSNVESKETVLIAPRKVKVTEPSMQGDCFVREFTSKTDCERFLKTLDILGCSVAAGPIFTTSLSQANEGELSKDCDFYSRVVCCFRATAACSVDPNDLRFSKEVLSELEKIGKAIKEQIKHGDRIEDACMRFLRTFGSHVNTGVLHMGGMKRFVGTYSGRAQPRDQVRSLVEHALSGYITMSSSDLLCSDTVKANAADLETLLNIPEPYDKLDLSNISLQTINSGGPDLANLPVWKMGLSVNRKSWALIDRCSLAEHKPIWDLVSIQEDFVEPIRIASHLQSSWENVIGVKKSMATSSKLYEIESSLDSWSSDPMFLENCQARLLHLLFAIEELFRETGSYGYWEYVLSPKKPFRQFLAKVETERNFPPESEQFIRYTWERVRSAGCEPALKSEFDHELKNVPVIMHTVTNVPSLVTTLKEKLLPFFKSIVKSKAECSKIAEVCITVELAVGISHLLQLKSSTLETLLLSICLSQVQYCHKKLRFEHDITVGKLEEFCSYVEDNLKRFHAVKGTFPKECFLVDLLLTSETFQMDETDQSQKKREFDRLIKDARHGFSQQMRDLLETHVTSPSPVQWRRMITITHQVASGKSSPTMFKISQACPNAESLSRLSSHLQGEQFSEFLSSHGLQLDSVNEENYSLFLKLRGKDGSKADKADEAKIIPIVTNHIQETLGLDSGFGDELLDQAEGGEAADLHAAVPENLPPKLEQISPGTSLLRPFPELEDCFRNALNQTQPRLVRHLEVQPVLNHLLSNNRITVEEDKQISKLEEKQHQVQELLDLVQKGGITHMYKLVQALQLHQSENKLGQVITDALAGNGKARLPLVVRTPTSGPEQLKYFSKTGKLRERYFEKLGDVLFHYGAVLIYAEKGSLRLMLLFVTLDALLKFVDDFNDNQVPQEISAVLLDVKETQQPFIPHVRSSIAADEFAKAARQLGSPEQDLKVLKKRHENKVPLEGGLGAEGRHSELTIHMSTLMSSLPYKVNEALFERRQISYDEYMMTREEPWHKQNKMMYTIALSKPDETGVKEAVCEGLCQSSQYCPLAPPERRSQPMTASEHEELLYHVRPHLMAGHDVAALLDKMKQDQIVDDFMCDFITAPGERHRKADRLMFYVSHLHSSAYKKFRGTLLESFSWVLSE